jgi:hypothetical protein
MRLSLSLLIEDELFSILIESSNFLTIIEDVDKVHNQTMLNRLMT